MPMDEFISRILISNLSGEPAIRVASNGKITTLRAGEQVEVVVERDNDTITILRGDGTVEDSRYVYRDAGTGKFVSSDYALLNPGTTVRDRVA